MAEKDQKLAEEDQKLAEKDKSKYNTSLKKLFDTGIAPVAFTRLLFSDTNSRYTSSHEAAMAHEKTFTIVQGLKRPEDYAGIKILLTFSDDTST